MGRARFVEMGTTSVRGWYLIITCVDKMYWVVTGQLSLVLVLLGVTKRFWCRITSGLCLFKVMLLGRENCGVGTKSWSRRVDDLASERELRSHAIRGMVS